MTNGWPGACICSKRSTTTCHCLANVVCYLLVTQTGNLGYQLGLPVNNLLVTYLTSTGNLTYQFTLGGNVCVRIPLGLHLHTYTKACGLYCLLYSLRLGITYAH
jgi:hypothetical protein